MAEEICRVSHNRWLNITTRKLKEMWKNSQLCDLMLKATGGHTIQCHSCILAANIPFVKTQLITFEAKSSNIVLSFDSISMEMVTYIVEFCYRGTVKLPKSKLNCLKDAALEMKFDTLANLCDRILGEADFSNPVSDRILKQNGDCSDESSSRELIVQSVGFVEEMGPYCSKQEFKEQQMSNHIEVKSNEEMSLSFIKEEMPTGTTVCNGPHSGSETDAYNQDSDGCNSSPKNTETTMVHKDLPAVSSPSLRRIQTLRQSCRQKASQVKKKYMKKNKRVVVNHKCSYTCNVCAKNFLYLHTLDDHMNIHKGLKPYKCDFCERKYFAEQSLKDHLKTHEGEQFPCDLCGKVFFSKKTVYRHRRNHPPDFVPKPDKLECTYCSQVFKHKNALDAHLNKHNGIRPYKCDQCNKDYHSIDALKLHKKDHQGNSFSCTMCDKILPTQKKLNRHIKEHGEKVYEEANHEPTEKCTECSRTFHTKQNLRRHVKLSHSSNSSFVCQACGKVLRTKGSLRSHMIGCTGEGKFTCDFCDQTFVAKESFKKHLKRFHIKECQQSEKYCSEVTLCAFCGEAFLSKKMLVLHEKLHKNENLFQCTTCNKSFREKSYLVAHVNSVHVNKAKQFQCVSPGCTKGFKSDKSLRRHARIHKGLYRYFCDFCRKGYDKLPQLNKHMMKCTLGPAGATKKDERPREFNCDICDKVMKSRQSLKRHRDIHTAEAKLSCEHCRKRYRRKEELRKHICTKPSLNSDNSVNGRQQSMFSPGKEHVVMERISSEYEETRMLEERGTPSYLVQQVSSMLPPMPPRVRLPEPVALNWSPQSDKVKTYQINL